MKCRIIHNLDHNCIKYTVELTKIFKSVINRVINKKQNDAKCIQIGRCEGKIHPDAVVAWFSGGICRKERRITCNQAVRAFFRLSKFPRKAKDHPAPQSTTPISCAALICINVSKGCRSILAGAFIGCAAVKQHWRIRRANARKGREKTNTISALCSSFLP